jgi:hypothetical protein
MTEVLAPLRAGDHVLADFLEASGNLPAAMIVRGHEPEDRVYLWWLSQDAVGGYDTYDSCVVAAVDEHSAKRIRPSFGASEWDDDRKIWFYTAQRAQPGTEEYDERDDEVSSGTWAEHPDQVTAVRIGVALDQAPGSVICASFNAG